MGIAGGTDYHREMAICYVEDGVLHRRADFDTLTQLFKFMEEHVMGPCLIYGNNATKKNLDSDQYPPIIIGPEYAYASCGDLLSHKPFIHDKVSDATMVKDQILLPAAETNPELLQNPAFAWMLKRIAREYVGAVFLRTDGTFVIINSNLFDYKNGVYSMDFAKTKKAVTTGKKVHNNSAKNLEVMAA